MSENSYAATKAARWLRSVSAFDRDQTVAVEQTVVSGSRLYETPSTSAGCCTLCKAARPTDRAVAAPEEQIGCRLIRLDVERRSKVHFPYIFPAN